MQIGYFKATGNSKEWLEQEVKPAVVEFLAERGLVLSPEKTKITHIRERFDFLGWNIRKYDGKLLMKPSKANVKAHLDKIREVIRANKTAKQANLIRLFNPILRGWANYHSHVVTKETFARVDADVWSALRNAGKATQADSAVTRSRTGGSDDFPSLAPSH